MVTRMNMQVLLQLMVVLVASRVMADAPKLEVGKPAPEIFVSEFIQGPDDAPRQLAQMRGQVVVLDFWTTWCAGCVLSVPHTNELAEALKSEPVRFITLNNETRSSVERFLNNTAIDTWIALDDEDRTTQAYGIGGYPQAVLIDKNGLIAALCHPQSLTVEAIRNVLNGKPAGIETTYLSGSRGNLDWAQGAAADPDAADAVSQVILRRTTATGGMMQAKPGSGQISGDGLGLRNLIMTAYDVEPAELEYRLPTSEELYRVSVRAPNGNDAAARAMLQSAIEASFPIDIQWQDKRKQVIVLQRSGESDGKCLAPSKASEGSLSASRMHIRGTNVGFDSVAKMIGQFMFSMPLIDETGLTGTYDIDLNLTGGKTKALAACGLKALRERRMVKTLVVKQGS